MARPRLSEACIVAGCNKAYFSKGYCRSHYTRFRRTGNPGGPDFQSHVRGRKCNVEGCKRAHSSHGYCSMHRERVKRLGDPGPAELMVRGYGTGHICKEGYMVLHRPGHPNAWGRGKIFEHMVVMCEILGRPLRKGETVHHKNGDKIDNRPDNLELWSRQHPGGQRVSDKVRFAAEFLADYIDDGAVWPGNMQGFRRLLSALFKTKSKGNT